MLPKILRSPFIPMFSYLLILGFLFISMIGSENNQSLVRVCLLILTAFTLVWVSLIQLNNRKYPESKIKYLGAIPPEFREMDEGQQWVTYKACRSVYIYYSYALPLIVGLCFALSNIKFMTLLLLGVLGIGQYIIYWLSIRKFKQF
ncbi:hypothetical protein CMV16_26550 [Peribacillus simplex]|jgi:hypothetical protein|nr:hypothetical protein CMV16_26550 [Peribacillus simplex]